MTFISRRDLLKRAAAVGEIAVPSGTRPFQASDTDGGAPAFHASESKRSSESLELRGREPLENLAATEAELLDAVVARLIPTDATGPGATEARAAHYIDRALGGALASSRPAYTSGLAAVHP